MKDQNGITLLEVMISLIILSIGLLGLAPMVALSISSNNTSRDVIDVSTLAKQKMELYQDAASLPSLPYRELETGVSGRYNRGTLIVDKSTDTTLADDVAYVQVLISWVDESGVPRASVYSTLVPKE
jgi:prepilin-type N-terminal cleavage/methylation domain-containing protein